MKEHLHAREKAGLFDISHMKLIAVEGPQAAAVLSRACPLDAAAMIASHARYTFFLNETAGILDDLIVTRLADTRFVVVANAGNAAADTAHLRAVARDYDCEVKPLDRVLLALQGPEAALVLASVGLDLSALAFMQGTEPRPGWFASRSGYTGEDGFEIALPPAQAGAFAQELLADSRVMWAGLAARDSLRLEAGLCLHGQDITPEIDPASAGLLWAIPRSLREKGGFIGAAALADIIAKGPREVRVGLRPEGRQPVRAGALLHDEIGNPAGHVTSGGFGPTLSAPVATGYVPPGLAAPGTRLFAEVRGSRIPVDLHPLPFTPHRYRKG